MITSSLLFDHLISSHLTLSHLILSHIISYSHATISHLFSPLLHRQDFSHVYPTFDLQHVNALELSMLEALKYLIKVSAGKRAPLFLFLYSTSSLPLLPLVSSSPSPFLPLPFSFFLSLTFFLFLFLPVTLNILPSLVIMLCYINFTING